ncbi:MAG: LLM class F420-dependent oxidoreductase [Anaerolineae bacterium]|nr:LLM class F420-dependent oxidoreductase [Anaerolineae bacterium]
MKIGLQLPSFDWPGGIGPKLAEIAQLADESGFASLWVMDHFFGIGGVWGEPEAPMLEGYSTLAYMAAVTKRLRLGLLVTGAFYRPPGLLIKTVSTLDVLSGGRAILGIGAGWYEREAVGLGMAFPSTRERLERLEETLQIAKHMWADDTTPFVGRYYHLTEPMNHPQPLSQPHPPILIGGEGEKQTLRLVATYGDACNFFLGTPLPNYPADYVETFRNRKQNLPHKLAVLREHCERIGRDYATIERTVLGSICLAPDAMSASEVVEICHELAEMGFQQVIFNMPNDHTLTPLATFGTDIIPKVSAFA